MADEKVIRIGGVNWIPRTGTIDASGTGTDPIVKADPRRVVLILSAHNPSLPGRFVCTMGGSSPLVYNLSTVKVVHMTWKDDGPLVTGEWTWLDATGGASISFYECLRG